MAGIAEQITKFEVASLPIGKALALSAGMGVGDVLKAVVRQWGVPPLATGLVAAWALVNIKMVRDLLGPATSELVAAGILADTINDQFRIQENTSNLLAGLFGSRVVSQSPPRLLNAGAPRNPNAGSVAGVTASTGVYRGVV